MKQTKGRSILKASVKEQPLNKQSLKKLIPMLMLIYTVAGIIGFIYEEICVYINDGVFFKRGTTYGPWIPIYGFGCLLIYFLTVRFRKKPWLVFLISALSCGSLELATGFVLDKFFHLRLWDYSLVILNWGNLNGYICVRSVTTWGIFALILIYAILPPFEKLQDRHPKVFNIIAVSLFSLFVLDIIKNFIDNDKSGFILEIIDGRELPEYMTMNKGKICG